MTIFGQKISTNGRRKIENDFRHLNGSTCFRWPYLANFAAEIELWAEMEEWCEKNCRGAFEFENYGLFIFDDNEAMRFKLVFG